MKFSLHSRFQPAGDQPEAIRQLNEALRSGERFQTLLGVTGSGKTFTMANVIRDLQRPTLIISHNKTLAAQLYGEFKSFFPENMVEYFISYYDYYQPEAYIPSTNTYIEKDLSVNPEIEKLRLRATSALLTGRRDVIIVASVSCIYGIGRPEDYASMVFPIQRGNVTTMRSFLNNLVNLLYARTQTEFKRGTFRVKGDTVDLYPAYEDFAIRFTFFGDEIEHIYTIDPDTSRKISDLEEYILYPANLFITSRERLNEAIIRIQADLMKQVTYFQESGLFMEANRIKERTEYDMEMMRELGYCSGIENYSLYLTDREPGSRPYCLLDYFPKDYLLVIDESHVTLPQIRGMYEGDRSRKMSLVENGFRLPSALDNRPQKFQEFESMINQAVFVSATPADYELMQTGGVVVEQIVRPTGLLDPEVEVRPCGTQIEDLLHEIDIRVKKAQRVLVTTLTKRMAEDLAKYLAEISVACRYIHSDVDSLERVDILRDLRAGKIDVLIGVNLLREGLDLPEVSLVAILDADKEGFLRSESALIQTAGRAARNVEGRVIMYADKVTKAMARLIQETEYRRGKQIAYNEAHGIKPQSVEKPNEDIFAQVLGKRESYIDVRKETARLAAESQAEYMNKEEIARKVRDIRKQMEAAAKELNFLEAARLRDEMFALQALL